MMLYLHWSMFVRVVCMLVIASVAGSTAEPYLEENGLLVMEAEHTESDLGHWQVSTTVSGYTGSGFLEFTGNKYQSGSAKSPLVYRFTIQNGGIYRFVPRAATTRPDSVPDDQGNDMFLKMAGDFTSGGAADLTDLQKNQKFFTILKKANKWVWGRQFDMNNSHTFREAEYNFKAGETYLFTISGRSQSYSIDRLVFYRMSDYSKSEAERASHPESSRGGEINQAPVVTAGNDLVVEHAQTSADLNGTATDDGLPVGGSLTFSWTQISGPVSVIADPDGKDTVVSLPEVGSYVFQLRVSDGEKFATDEVRVTRPEGSPAGVVLDALDDFAVIQNGPIPYYRDVGNDALAIDASRTAYRGPFARATTTFNGISGRFDVTITTLTEEDGESTYRLLINGERVGSYVNPYVGPGSERDLEPHTHTWHGITLSHGDTMSIESNAVTNGEIPEGGGTAWARGRWQHIEIFPHGGTVPGALPGQILVDPKRGNYLVRNQDLNNDGELDPYMMAGVGGPEQFFYLGSRQADGTRSGGRQQQIIDELVASGANGIYIQSIRSFGGDAGKDATQAPFNDYNDPDSGLDPDIMTQWHGWMEQFEEHDIGVLFFIYDDHAKPWGSSGDAVPAGEQAYITAIINEFERYPNVIFVMAEEYRFARFSDQRMSNMAAVAAAAMDHGHALGVHHNIGLENQFVDDPNINIFVQQADVRNGDKMDKLHREYGTGQGFDEAGRFAYVMGEAFGLHQNLVGVDSKRDELRQSLYATAMAGGITTAFGAYEDEWGRDPTQGNLEDMGRLVEFFHTTPFNTMDHNDALAHGDSDWVKADVGQRYIAYSLHAPTNGMGVRGLPNGSYDLRWFDAKDGEWVTQNEVRASGDTAFVAPTEMNNDTVLEIIRVDIEDGNSAPVIAALDDIQVDFAVESVTLNATVSDDGLPSDTLFSTWEQLSGPVVAVIATPSAEDTEIILPEAGAYEFRLTVSDGELSSSREVRVTRRAKLGDLVYAINCGGGLYTAANGIVYQEDTYFVGGNAFVRSAAISGTEDDELYYSERYAEHPEVVEYALPVNSGTYLLTLMWSENTGNGRLMDVIVEGQVSLAGLDVVAEAGGNKVAYEQTLTVAVEDGQLSLRVGKNGAAKENYPNLMAIRLRSKSVLSSARTITMENVEGLQWRIAPDGTVDRRESDTAFEQLDAKQDHVLTLSPGGNG